MYPDSADVHPAHRPLRGPALAIVVVGVWVVAIILCVQAASSPDVQYGAVTNIVTTHYTGGPITVEAGATIRLSPHVINPNADGADNACATVDVAFQATPLSVTPAENDPNGIWYEFRRSDLPPGIQSQCRTRPIIWVNWQGVRAP